MEKHESKLPCLMVLDLEVICYGKELFHYSFQGKAFYHYLVCSLCCDTVSAPVSASVSVLKLYLADTVLKIKVGYLESFSKIGYMSLIGNLQSLRER